MASCIALLLAALLTAALLAPAAPAQETGDGSAAIHSPIRHDEEVVLFPTLASRTADGEGWRVDVRGWIFEPEEDSRWRGLAVGLSTALPGLEREDLDDPRLQRRLRAFLVDNERGKRLPLRVAGRVERLPPTGPDGHVAATLRLTDAVLATALDRDDAPTPATDRPSPRAARTTPPAAWLPLEVLASADDPRRFTGRVLLVPPAGLSVISDIDDTVKLSHVTDKQRLLRTTFLEEWQAVPGMAELYARLAERGALFHYVSSSPWQLGPELQTFLADAGLPAGSFHLKSFRAKDRTLFDLFASAEETKPAVIGPLLQRFPGRRFVLIGDSGEKDPEVYGRMAREHPAQVARILIRTAPGGDNTPERFAAAFAGLPAEAWQVFTDPADVALP